MTPRPHHPYSQRAFSLIELLCILGVLLVLCALLFPLIDSARGRSRAAQCLSNLRQISVAAAAYSGDHNNHWPPSATGVRAFSNALIPYLGDVPGRGSRDFMKSPFICPAARVDSPNTTYIYQGIYTPASYPDPVTGKPVTYGLSYAQNVYAPGNQVPSRTSVEFPSQMMLYLDFQSHYVSAMSTWINPLDRERLEKRHRGDINVAFVDGSVRSLKYADIPTATPTRKRFWVGHD